MTARAVALLALLSALSACVTFERAPVETLACDPALAGEWRPVKDGPTGRTITVAADCAMQWPEDGGGTYATRLEGFALGGSRYLVFTPEVADRLMAAGGDMARKAPEGSVFLARYRIDGDDARVWLADEEEAMRPPAKGQAAGTRLDETRVHVAGSRPAIAKLLRARGETLFAGKPDGKGMLRLRRVAAAAAP